LAACPEHRLMNHAADIMVMFDKRRCHELLSRAGHPVPRSLGAIESFEELVERMKQAECRRVFVKLAHGSSASGAVAYQTDGRRHQATTTVEMVQRNGELHLYNSRRIRVYRELDEIAALIDALCRHRVHVEQWLPKAGIDGHAFDLRVVVIGGQARHTVVRMSRSPMTNLHLLNRRGSVDAVRARMDPAAWAAALRTCEAVMRSFPASLYGGIDLLVTPDYRHHAVLEINAFGDLLPDLLWEGLDTYAAEILALIAPLPAFSPSGRPTRTPERLNA
jgi:glutathione synthase/RimK-type ligase-like ATP-grasp enzyme